MVSIDVSNITITPTTLF